MGMIKNDIDDVVDALTVSEGRDKWKVARRLFLAGLNLLDISPSFHTLISFHAKKTMSVSQPGIECDRVAVIAVDKLEEMNIVLREAADTFDGYATNHAEKVPPQLAKAQRNLDMAGKCYAALGEVYAPPSLPFPDEATDAAIERESAADTSFAAWKADVQAGEAAEVPENGVREPAGALEGVFAPGSKAGSAKALLRGIYDAMEAGKPAKGVDVHLDDRPALDTMVELKLVTRDDVSDVLGVSLEARLMLGIRPRGAIDLPVEVAEITGNIAEAELCARYCEGKVKAIDMAIAKREAPMYEMQCSWEESYGHAAMTLRAMAQEFRQGLHIPSTHGEARIIPYNEDRSTGISHRVALDTFFDDVHARNVMAGWWTDITTGLPKKRSVGELFILFVTEIAEAYDAYINQANDDKLTEYPGLGVELGDLAIRLADFAGAMAAGRIVAYSPSVVNPGDEAFQQVVEIAKGYEAIRKTPAAIGMDEIGEPLPAIAVGKLIDAKLAYNATRADHKIENRLKEDGKRT